MKPGSAFVSRKLPDGEALIDWLPNKTMVTCWVRDGEGIVGWGEAARLAIRGVDRFSEAQRWWSSLLEKTAVDDQVDVWGSGPVAFASFAFASESESVVIVPRVVIGRRNGLSWATTIDGPAPDPEPRSALNGLAFREGYVGDQAHRDSVAEAVSRIRAGELAKVVLARDLIASADNEIDQRVILARLSEQYPTCWTYAVDGFVGSTPELLLRRRGAQISSRVLAGTMWPSHDGADDRERLAKDLLRSKKNRAEHALGVRSVTEALRDLCETLDVPDEPSVLHIANVSHLSTEISAVLREPLSVLELAAHVHPTAAVSGWPRSEARRVIGELEGMERGGYLGPVGWWDAAGDGELGVALRCAIVNGNTAHLFAGGGIMADSDPATEAAEAAAKFNAMRTALEPRG